MFKNNVRVLGQLPDPLPGANDFHRSLIFNEWPRSYRFKAGSSRGEINIFFKAVFPVSAHPKERIEALLIRRPCAPVKRFFKFSLIFF